MAVNRNVSSVILVVLVSLFIHTKANYTIGRSGFPKGFIFGAGSSAYQVEGGAKAEGKGPSIWDFYTHKDPGSVWDKSDGDVAADFFHRYKEDIQLMKEMGLDYFRFSISWPRILPKGNKAGGINRKGIEFYNNLINELLAHGIKPFVTLYHWDVPQALEEKYGGFLSPKIMADFTNYADVCFQEFGDRVKHWVTLDEPNINAELGYATGFLAPNRCTRTNTSYPCVAGNSATEPYIVGHHLLLSHAYAVTLYRNKYQEFQKGQIGITVGCSWVEPFDMSRTTLFATMRAFEQSCGWFFSPVTFGDYPESMRKLIKERLPKFTPEESNLLKNSSDFLGVNYYTGSYVKDHNATTQHYNEDANAIKTFWDKNGIPIGKPTPVPWIFDYPEGLRNLTLYMKRQYNNPVIYVMENGYATKDEPNKTYSRDYYLKDQHRIDYLNGHLSYLQRAIMAGANVKGYLASSFLDSFEWSAGYILKSGFNYVDHEDRLKRHKKDSAKWYQQFLRS